MHLLSTEPLSLSELQEILQGPVQLSESARNQIEACRQYLDHKLSHHSDAIYGINTGFGSLCQIRISDSDIELLQENLVRSHACGLGEEVPVSIVRLMLLLKIRNFIYGHSGVSLALTEQLLMYYNHAVYPVVYQLGSLGASGDLAPLAHLSLPLLNEGWVSWEGQRITAAEINQRFGWKPLRLQSKEGLALLNGTQFMSAYGLYSLMEFRKLLNWAELICAVSMDAYACTDEPLNPHIHHVRAYPGQVHTAAALRAWLHGSDLNAQVKQQVQDPYCFRCVPQVHGASRDAANQAEQIFLREINSVTDNPLIFPQEDLIVSGGNFHGQPLAIHLDYLAIAVAELAHISERRIYQLISGQRGLPPFLVSSAGLDSGFMIAQYTAASIVSKNKQLCTPASVDSIVSSNGQEDHVSMGANAATKLYEVVLNTQRVLAIEWLIATQAIEFRRPLQSSPAMEEVIKAFRLEVQFLSSDRILHDDITRSIHFLNTYSLRSIHE